MNAPAESMPPGAHVPPPAPRRWPLVALALLILVSGMVIGAVVSAVVTRRAVIGALRDPGPVSTRLVSRLTEDLGLTEAQTEGVRRIVEKRAANLRELRAEVAPRFREEVRLMEEEIAGVLNAEQVELWKRRVQRMREFAPPSRRGGPRPGEERERGGEPHGPRRRREPGPGREPPPEHPPGDWNPDAG